MVDSTTLIVLTSVAQTVVITLTLFVFIFQFRSQERAIKDSAYQNLVGRYNDYIRMLVEKPELTELLFQVERATHGVTDDISKEDKTRAAYMLMGYGMFEEIYTLHKKKWIDQATWDQWAAFLERYCQQPMFRRVYEISKGTFDPDFEEHVGRLMKKDG